MVIHADVLIRADGTLHLNQNIAISDDSIKDIGAGSSKHADASYSVVTPLFHNGHSHCEYQLLSGILETSQFFPWVRDVVRIKQFLTPDFWKISSIYGVAKLLQMGFASTWDCSESGYTPAIMDATGLRGMCFREVNGLVPELDLPRCDALIDLVLANTSETALGVAPHAIYSTCDALLENIRNRCSSIPLCIHTDESQDEDRFCRFGDGEFSSMYARRGINRKSPMSSAVQYFDTVGLLTSQTLLVHGCSWDEHDLLLIKERGAMVSVCPESNEFLRCHPAPVDELYRNEIPIAIGTDSALSCPSLSPIQQLNRLMRVSIDENFHRWLFRAQTSPIDGLSYDVTGGGKASFCCFERNQVIASNSLTSVISQIATLTPDIYRLGKRVNYELGRELELQVNTIVKGLA
jgi:cytosine/adenosine deaminase-related metal-dependent hydrolase